MPPEWYEQPVFYFSNNAAIYGPDDEIPYPEGSEELDYELEVAAVVGGDEVARGSGRSKKDAEQAAAEAALDALTG